MFGLGGRVEQVEVGGEGVLEGAGEGVLRRLAVVDGKCAALHLARVAPDGVPVGVD